MAKLPSAVEMALGWSTQLLKTAASVAPDGKLTITNGRNGFSKTYTTR